MSAYMVDRAHIGYLLDAAMDQRITRGHFRWHHQGEIHKLQAGDSLEQICAVGQMLWDANKASIQARYPDTLENFCENAPGPVDETFIYDQHPYDYHSFDAVQVMKSCNCFNYQACEYEGWAESEAKCFIDGLIHYSTSALPGYDAAEWGAPEKPVGILLSRLCKRK